MFITTQTYRSSFSPLCFFSWYTRIENTIQKSPTNSSDYSLNTWRLRQLSLQFWSCFLPVGSTQAKQNTIVSLYTALGSSTPSFVIQVTDCCNILMITLAVVCIHPHIVAIWRKLHHSSWSNRIFTRLGYDWGMFHVFAICIYNTNSLFISLPFS